jgi:hypothetical protein
MRCYRCNCEKGDHPVYSIKVHQNLKRFVLLPWWATVTVGIASMGEAGAGVWHARTRDRLIRKVERKLKRYALSRGCCGPIIEVRED